MKRSQYEENERFWKTTFGVNSTKREELTIFDEFLVTVLLVMLLGGLFFIMTAVAYKSELYSTYLLGFATVAFPLFFICRFLRIVYLKISSWRAAKDKLNVAL